MTIHDHIAQMLSAAKVMDWEQVVLNSGPPCFHLQNDGRFCGRAERWAGHDGDPHKFVSFHDLLRKHADALEIAVKALEHIAATSSCECWDVPGMGSGLDCKWKGCRAFHNASLGEWCLTCWAHRDLAAINERLNRKL